MVAIHSACKALEGRVGKNSKISQGASSRYTNAFSIDVRKSSVASLCRHGSICFPKEDC